MTVNSAIAIAMLIFIAALAVSTVMVSIKLIKEIKNLKSQKDITLEKEEKEIEKDTLNTN